jgi:hypothetical protein
MEIHNSPLLQLEAANLKRYCIVGQSLKAKLSRQSSPQPYNTFVTAHVSSPYVVLPCRTYVNLAGMCQGSQWGSTSGSQIPRDQPSRLGDRGVTKRGRGGCRSACANGTVSSASARRPSACGFLGGFARQLACRDQHQSLENKVETAADQI